MSEPTLHAQAAEAVRSLEDENPTYSTNTIALLAYLEGYMVGHKAAMKAAGEIVSGSMPR